MKFILIILLIGFSGIVLSHNERDEEEDQYLNELAINIMQNLQKDHIPSQDGSSTGGNTHMHYMHSIGKYAMNSENIDKSDKTKITVGVKGVQFVSVERNGKVVNISTGFGMGAVALYSVDKRDFAEKDQNYVSYESDREIDQTLDSMADEYLFENSVAKPNETKVFLAQKTRFDLKVESTNLDKPKFRVNVDEGYVVTAKTNVTKGFKYFNNY